MIIAGFMPTRDEWEAALKRIAELEAQLATLTAENEALRHGPNRPLQPPVPVP
jgi:hypothetical protein